MKADNHDDIERVLSNHFGEEGNIKNFIYFLC